MSAKRYRFPCSYSRRAGIGVKDVDPNELRMGIKVEQEHHGGTKDANRKACWTSLQHIAEDDRYYTHLLAMERRYKGHKRKRGSRVRAVARAKRKR